MFRDYSLVETRLADLRREASGSHPRPFVADDAPADRGQPGRFRSGVAGVARWFGQHALQVAN